MPAHQSIHPCDTSSNEETGTSEASGHAQCLVTTFIILVSGSVLRPFFIGDGYVEPLGELSLPVEELLHGKVASVLQTIYGRNWLNVRDM